MKRLCLFLFFYSFLVNRSFAQVEEEIYIINIEDRIDLSHSPPIAKINIKRKLSKKTYQTLTSQVMDSIKFYKGDCAKIIYYDDGAAVEMEKNWKWPDYIRAEIYSLNADYKDVVISEIKHNQKIRDSILENRTAWQKIFNIDPVKKEKEKHASKWAVKEFFKSIPSDSIKKGFFEIGGMGGADYLFLLANINLSSDLYLINSRSNKISINNKLGVLAGFGLILYDYPSIKYHRRISNSWITISFGREFNKYRSADQWSYRVIDYRIDLGLKMYKRKNLAMEIYLPLRIDDEIPVYFTGPSINWTYIF